jgi:hypothetical protein
MFVHRRNLKNGFELKKTNGSNEPKKEENTVK